MSSKSNNSTNDVSGVAEGAAGDVDAVDGTAAAASATTMLASNRPSYPITGANSAAPASEPIAVQPTQNVNATIPPQSTSSALVQPVVVPASAVPIPHAPPLPPSTSNSMTYSSSASSSSSSSCSSSSSSSAISLRAAPLPPVVGPPVTHQTSSNHQQEPTTAPIGHQHHHQHLHPLQNPYQHMQQHHQQHQRNFNNKSAVVFNNSHHNQNNSHPPQHQQHHHLSSSFVHTHPSSYAENFAENIGTATAASSSSLAHKAGPAYFNFSRQRYTPYYSRSFSNGSNDSNGSVPTMTSNNHNTSFGRHHVGVNSYLMGAPLQQHQQHQLPQHPHLSSMPLSQLQHQQHNSHHAYQHNVSMPPPISALQQNHHHQLNTSDSGFLSNSYETVHSDGTAVTGGNLSLNGSHSSLCNASFPPASSALLSAAAMQQQSNNSGADNSVTLQISNIDTSIEDRALKHYLLSKLKPLTPILSFAYEGLSMVKIRVPSQHHAKQVVSYLHRKKIGHKRITVSYTRDSSTMEPSTLRCQVAGLLKDIPFYKLSMYKFRELFQSRFKTSISVMDLYDMKDICTIAETAQDEKFISLRPELISSIENSELLGCLQLSVPYCTAHFKSGHRGWAELEIEPLPNVYMTVAAVRAIVYDLLKRHKGDIPIASLVYCVDAELGVQIERNEAGVNLEHLISCVSGVHITTNKFGIKILSWLAANSVAFDNGRTVGSDQSSGAAATSATSEDGFSPPQQMYGSGRYVGGGGGGSSRFANAADPFGQISREIVELVKLSPKSTMKFSRFIPAYHNHFGKQCRVADYGYTKLIELFEALSGVVQVMGEGENRQITLTHKCQTRCFTADILRLLRGQPNKAMPMPHLESLFTFGSSHTHKYEITNYGVCALEDILESLIRNNVVCLERTNNTVQTTAVQTDETTTTTMVVAIPKRRQTRIEVQKTCTFAGEVVELLRNASQYSIPFEKLTCSYHYNYGYQCRLSDYGFLKLTDLMEAITGVVEIEMCNGGGSANNSVCHNNSNGETDGERRVRLSPMVAQRVFAEQLRDLTRMLTSSSATPMNLSTLLFYHKKQFGYQMLPQSLGIGSAWYGIGALPFVEVTGATGVAVPAAPESISSADIVTSGEDYVIVCHQDDAKFVYNSYAACRVILESGAWAMPLAEFIDAFFAQFSQIMGERAIEAMNHAVELFVAQTDGIGAGEKFVRIAPLMVFVLRIVGVLEMMSVVSVNDLKSILNIGIADCFPYGYPNLMTLLQAFGDVFVCLSATVGDMSEITLNKQCLLAKNGVQEFIRGGAANFRAAECMAQHQQQQLQQQQQQQQYIQHQMQSRFQQPPPLPPPPAVSHPYRISTAMPLMPSMQNWAQFDSAWADANNNNMRYGVGIGGTGGLGRGGVSDSERALSSKYSTPPGLHRRDSFEELRKSSPPNAITARATAEKENFFFNIMQSADFDISAIEKLFFESAFSSTATASSSLTTSSPPSAFGESNNSAGSSSNNTTLDTSTTTCTTSKVVGGAVKHVPLYERKPSNEWLQKCDATKAEKTSGTSSAGVDEEGISSPNNSSTDTSDDASAGESPASTSSNGSSDGSSILSVSGLFDAPKADTSPSNVPFWMDPVWRHDSPAELATATPLDESLNIMIPELKTFEVLPALDTPTVMKRLLENNASQFTFDF